MSDTPKTDTNCGWPVGHHGRIESSDLKLSPDGPFVHSSVARQLERENAALRESLEIEKKRSSYWNDFADNATILNAQLRADKDRLDWLLDNISPDSVLWNVNPAEDSMSEGAPDPWRAAIDTARKRAKP